MAHFIVTFRIKNDSDYQERYESFIKKAEELADGGIWDETTSFLAFKSKANNATASSVCSDLYYGSEFSEYRDVMVVIDLDAKSKATKGEIKYPSTLQRCLGF